MEYTAKLSILVSLLLTFSVLGQDQVISGLTISKQTSWSGKIIIEGDVIVKKNARLTIAPGSQILFSPNIDKSSSGKDKTRSELIVKGVLIAKGSVERKITFSSAAEEPRMGDWYGIQLINSKQPSIIDYTLIEFAYNGITIKKNSSVIRNSQIRLNYNAGISCEVKASPPITKNIISENGYAGIITSLGAKPVLSLNLISLNEIGVIVFKTSVPNLGNLKKGSSYNLGQNNIFENTDYDLYNHSAEQLIAENNSWGNESSVNSRIYGSVDVRPFYRQQNIDELFEITQETPSGLIADASASQVSAAQLTDISTQNTGTLQESESVPLLAANSPTLLPNAGNAETNDLSNDEAINEESEDLKPVPVQPVNTERVLASTVESKPIKPAINYNQVFFEQFLDSRKAELVKQVAPKINFNGPKGRVIVRAVVDRNGNVESASVVRSLDARLDNLSVEASLKFKYKPGTIKGVPVKFSKNIQFIFK